MKKQTLNLIKKGIISIIVAVLIIMPTISFAASNNSIFPLTDFIAQRGQSLANYKGLLNETMGYLNNIDSSISVTQAKSDIISFITEKVEGDYSDSPVALTYGSKIKTATFSSNAETTPDLVNSLLGSVKNLLSSPNKAFQSLTPNKEVTINAVTAGSRSGEKYNVKLVGKIYYSKPSNNQPTSDKWVLLLHGVMMNGQAMADSVGQMYLDNGYNILAIDSRGHGDSEGSVAMGYLESLDAWDWLNYINKQYANYSNEIIIHGVSLGGATTVFTAGLDLKSQDVIGIVEDCGYTSLTGIIQGMLGGTKDETIKEDDVSLLSSILNLPSQLLSGILGSQPAEDLIKTLLINLVDVGLTSENFDKHNDALVGLKNNCEVPILIIHGTADTTVPYANSSNIYKAASDASSKVPYVQRFEAKGEPHAFITIGSKENVYKAHVEKFIENAEAIDSGDTSVIPADKTFEFNEPAAESQSLTTSLIRILKLLKNMLS